MRHCRKEVAAKTKTVKIELLRVIRTYNIVVQDCRSLGTSAKPCLLQSTTVPRQTHLEGQAIDCEQDNPANSDNQTFKKHSTLASIKRSCLVSLSCRDPIVDLYFFFSTFQFTVGIVIRI